MKARQREDSKISRVDYILFHGPKSKTFYSESFKHIVLFQKVCYLQRPKTSAALKNKVVTFFLKKSKKKVAVCAKIEILVMIATSNVTFTLSLSKKHTWLLVVCHKYVWIGNCVLSVVVSHAPNSLGESLVLYSRAVCSGLE